MSRKALIIIDHLPARVFHGMREELAVPAVVGELELGFIPRTTPVGHATISTGRLPCDHRVQGRRWYVRTGDEIEREDVEVLQVVPPPGYRLSGLIQTALEEESIGACIRAQGNAPIVAAAGKGFLPFLLGGRAADVLIYPFSVQPEADGLGGYRLVVGVVAQTKSGYQALNAVEQQLRNSFEILTAEVGLFTYEWVTRKTEDYEKQYRQPCDRDVQVLELHWVVPEDWYSAEKNDEDRESAVTLRWRNAMSPYWVRVDDEYERLSLKILEELERIRNTDGVLLQSRFSTDTFGHRYGVEAEEYLSSVRASLQAVDRLVSAGFTVAVTSDHGGRPTPYLVRFDEDNRRTDPEIAMPEHCDLKELFRSGDHLVGYHSSANGSPEALWWNGTMKQAVLLNPAVVKASFIPSRCRTGSFCLLRTDNSHPGGDEDQVEAITVVPCRQMAKLAKLTALYRSCGREALWRIPCPGLWRTSAIGSCRSSPTFDDGRRYAASWNGSSR